MPSNSLAYQRANYKKYWGSKKTIKKIGERVKARRMMEKAWKVSKGDGKHVDHKKPLSSGGKTTKSNLRVISAKKNMQMWAKIATRIKNKKK